MSSDVSFKITINQFSASLTADFLSLWEIHHRVSSAYYPQSNGRAEVAVKKAKRILMENIGPTGSLDNDNFLRAMLQIRNTHDPDCNISPAEIVFGRPIRDAFSFVNRCSKFSNPSVHPEWRKAWSLKEKAMRCRMTRTCEKLNEHTRQLQPLQISDHVFIQNQHGAHPSKWDKSGKIIDVKSHNQYLVKVNGSGRVTVRNRRFLRKFTPAAMTVNQSGYKPQQLITYHLTVLQAMTLPIENMLNCMQMISQARQTAPMLLRQKWKQ